MRSTVGMGTQYACTTVPGVSAALPGRRVERPRCSLLRGFQAASMRGSALLRLCPLAVAQ